MLLSRAALHRDRLHRQALTGILFVLKTGIPWEDFPREMGCCGMTLWNRLDEWRGAGVWPRLHAALLAHVTGRPVMLRFTRHESLKRTLGNVGNSSRGNPSSLNFDRPHSSRSA